MKGVATGVGVFWKLWASSATQVGPLKFVHQQCHDVPTSHSCRFVRSNRHSLFSKLCAFCRPNLVTLCHPGWP